ncbi:hypothetical protein AVEN_67162-1, partial [Araneus ventricosus]
RAFRHCLFCDYITGRNALKAVLNLTPQHTPEHGARTAPCRLVSASDIDDSGYQVLADAGINASATDGKDSCDNDEDPSAVVADL